MSSGNLATKASSPVHIPLDPYTPLLWVVDRQEGGSILPIQDKPSQVYMQHSEHSQFINSSTLTVTETFLTVHNIKIIRGREINQALGHTARNRVPIKLPEISNSQIRATE